MTGNSSGRKSGSRTGKLPRSRRQAPLRINFIKPRSSDRGIRKLTYRRAGVDIDLADRLVDKISLFARKTRRPEVVADIGGFGGLFSLAVGKYRDPVLVASTDGVGTKLKLAILLDKHDTVGIDLVAMNVNDVLTTGAEPLFFLDYIAVGKLELPVLTDVVKGMVRGLRDANCCLLGGETAEMPGMYARGDYDLAGFCVGVVERRKILDGSSTRPGDLLIGLASTGVHSNGYSLVRKVFPAAELKGRLGRQLLTPTRIYVRPVLSLLRTFNSGSRVIRGAAHITGGGFPGNIPRVLPDGMGVKIRPDSWPVPSIFSLIRKRGNVDIPEMFRTFNMGVGMVLVVAKEKAAAVQRKLVPFRLRSWVIGEVIRGKSRWW